MSINLRLLLFCLIFGALTFSVGVVSQRGHGRITTLFSQDYAKVKGAVAALQSADQTAALTAAHFSDMPDADAALDAEDRDVLATALGSMLTEVRGAYAAARTTEAQRASDVVLYTLLGLQGTHGGLTRRALMGQFAKIENLLDGAITIFSSDAGVVAGEIEEQIEASASSNLAGLVCSFLGLGAIAFLISRGLVAPLRHATSVVAAMAKGELAGRVMPDGASEFQALGTALKELKTSMQVKSEAQRRSTLVQTSALGSALTAKENQFLAAMNNMTQGLCMLDADLNLVVFNEPFAVMFESFRHGASAAEVLADPQFHLFLGQNETGNFMHEMPNGDIFQVKRRGVRGGGLVITFENVTAQHHFSQRLEHLAGHDALTGLANRRRFRDALQEILTGRPGFDAIAVFYLDLSDFKAINDTFGHPIGDGLLKAVGARLAACAGPRDIVARLGGDEFAIIQEAGAQPEAAAKLADCLLQAFEAAFTLEDRPVHVDVSIGIVSVRAKDAEATRRPDVVMQSSDLALFEAKRQPGSSYRFYTPDMRESLRTRREFEADLRMALARNELDIVYEPFVDTRNHRISGFEALLRWNHPVRGVVSPSIFIPVAEELGLIADIGLWTLRTACAEAAGWPSGLTLSVNLSPVQFRCRTLVDDVARALVDAGLAASQLQLEVTESLFLAPSQDILPILTALRTLGTRIAMDDFGTGYSSLGYLTRFPFDKIKIDQSFVNDIHKPESKAVIRAVIGLSRSLNIAVIAEGIETMEQCRLLQADGCHEMQGYLFSRPRPASELPQLLMEVSLQLERMTAGRPGPASSAPVESDRLAG